MPVTLLVLNEEEADEEAELLPVLEELLDELLDEPVISMVCAVNSTFIEVRSV